MTDTEWPSCPKRSRTNLTKKCGPKSNAAVPTNSPTCNGRAALLRDDSPHVIAAAPLCLNLPLRSSIERNCSANAGGRGDPFPVVCGAALEEHCEQPKATLCSSMVCCIQLPHPGSAVRRSRSRRIARVLKSARRSSGPGGSSRRLSLGRRARPAAIEHGLPRGRVGPRTLRCHHAPIDTDGVPAA
jgi:hypothetical protein